MIESHPSRVRGLKQEAMERAEVGEPVAPFTGAWIETIIDEDVLEIVVVAPFTGAWIETPAWSTVCSPSRVAPFTGAWIETVAIYIPLVTIYGRTLHGCVD